MAGTPSTSGDLDDTQDLSIDGYEHDRRPSAATRVEVAAPATRPELNGGEEINGGEETEKISGPMVESVVVDARRHRARTSGLATLGLMLGLSSLYASLSGLLAPVGIALGLLGGLAAVGGLRAIRRRRRPGRAIAVLGLLLAVAGLGSGILAMTGGVSWLDSGSDQVAALRAWIDAWVPWLAGR